MSEFIVDVEADGPCPGKYSMIALGCVCLQTGNTFLTYLCPISDAYIPEALAVSGFTREETLKFLSPSVAMQQFYDWIIQNSRGRAVFVSDNPAFDWQFVNYYFWKYLYKNPFGHSARRIGDFAAGLAGDWKQQSKWKSLRDTPHTHNPLDDALGNAEALRKLLDIKK